MKTANLWVALIVTLLMTTTLGSFAADRNSPRPKRPSYHDRKLLEKQALEASKKPQQAPEFNPSLEIDQGVERLKTIESIADVKEKTEAYKALAGSFFYNKPLAMPKEKIAKWKESKDHPGLAALYFVDIKTQGGHVFYLPKTDDLLTRLEWVNVQWIEQVGLVLTPVSQGRFMDDYRYVLHKDPSASSDSTALNAGFKLSYLEFLPPKIVFTDVPVGKP